MMACCLRNIAYTFGEKQEPDSCIIYYNKALILSQQQGNKRLEAEILGQMASCYLLNNNYKLAERYIQIGLSSVDDVVKSPFYNIASKVYMETGQYDSAHYYSKELLKMGTVYAKQTASWNLENLYLQKKDYEKSAKYLRLFDIYRLG